MDPAPQQLFITGAYRSGTTLVDKLLHAHPAAAIASQPFPYLYIEAKRRFLASLGYADRYPLGNRFLELRYTDNDLNTFLDSDFIEAAAVRALLEEMRSYPGFIERRHMRHPGQLGGGTLVELQRRLHQKFAEVFGHPEAAVVGSKEILTEELVPHLLDHGLRVVLVVRDPRAVLASLIYGRGVDYGGSPRPVLFHLRNWRKGAAYALALRQHPLVEVLRFEDVLASTSAALLPVWTLLDVEPLDLQVDALKDQSGAPWLGNSSFPGVGGELNRWQHVLDARTVKYVETCTYPEMLALGYEPNLVGGFDGDVLRSFVEPVPIDRAEFIPGWGSSADRVDEEEARLLMVGRELSPPEAGSWFVQPETQIVLRQVLG